MRTRTLRNAKVLTRVALTIGCISVIGCTSRSSLENANSNVQSSSELRELDQFIGDMQAYRAAALASSDAFCKMSFSSTYEADLRQLNTAIGSAAVAKRMAIDHVAGSTDFVSKAWQACTSNQTCQQSVIKLRAVLPEKQIMEMVGGLASRYGFVNTSEAASKKFLTSIKPLGSFAQNLATEALLAFGLMCDLSKTTTFALDQVIAEAGYVRADIVQDLVEANYVEVKLCKRISKLPPQYANGLRMRTPEWCDKYHFVSDTPSELGTADETINCPKYQVTPSKCIYQQAGSRTDERFRTRYITVWRDLWRSKHFPIGLEPGTPIIRLRTCNNGKQDMMQVQVRGGSLRNVSRNLRQFSHLFNITNFPLVPPIRGADTAPR